jgi:phage terminase small subunit
LQLAFLKKGREMTAERKLTPAEREKVAQILAGNGNVSTVAEALGIPRSDGRQLNKHINNRQVQVRAQELIRTKFERRNITGDRVMTELARLAFASAKDMFDPQTGKMLEIHEMDDDTAATIVGFDVEERFEGRGDAATPYTVKKVKRGDKLGALSLLAKHFKLVSDNDGVNALAGALADRLNAAKKRVQPLDDVSDATYATYPQQHDEATQFAADLAAVADGPTISPAIPEEAAPSPTTQPQGDDDEDELW